MTIQKQLIELRKVLEKNNLGNVSKLSDETLIDCALSIEIDRLKKINLKNEQTT
jgi:hypothetical protein